MKTGRWFSGPSLLVMFSYIFKSLSYVFIFENVLKAKSELAVELTRESGRIKTLHDK